MTSVLAAAEPVQAIVLLDPAMANFKQDVVNHFSKNPLWFMARSIGEGKRDFSIEHAKIDVEVGALKTFKLGRYVLEVGRPVPEPRGDAYYPYALYYRDATKKKLVLLCQESVKLADWRRPVPDQLPRLFGTIPLSVHYFLPPSVMPAGGIQTEGDRFANLSRPPLPSVFPIKSAVVNGSNVSEAALVNRLPVKVAMRLDFIGSGFKVEAAPYILEPGQKRSIAVDTGTDAVGSVRASSIFIVDEDLEAFKAP